MSGELTPKQERFCQKYIELGCATKAYYAAYNAKGSKPITANRAAKTLLDNPKIAARVRALVALHQKRHEVTVDSITAELEEARSLALEIKQPAAAVSASMGKGKLHGLVVEKQEVKAEVETKDTSALETARRIAFIFEKAMKDKE